MFLLEILRLDSAICTREVTLCKYFLPFLPGQIGWKIGNPGPSTMSLSPGFFGILALPFPISNFLLFFVCCIIAVLVLPSLYLVRIPVFRMLLQEMVTIFVVILALAIPAYVSKAILTTCILVKFAFVKKILALGTLLHGECYTVKPAVCQAFR